MAERSGSNHGTDQVDAYLAQVVQPQQDTLRAVRASLRSILPHAQECLKYGVPAVALDGKGVAGYAAYKDHCSYLPMSGSVLEAAGDAVASYEVSKGALLFGVDKAIPVSLIRRLVKLRLAEISAVENGVRNEYFGDGQLKASGRMKDGELHGSWTWFRQDGSVSRTGQFRNGEQVGTWETFDRTGALVTSKRL